MRAVADPAARSRVPHLLGLAVVVGVSPFLASAVALVLGGGDGYRPAGDLAMTEMHVRDIGRHAVLVGLHSRPSWSHPGPLLFYLLAPGYWLTASSSLGLVLGALAINGTAVAGSLVVAWRRGGAAVLLCTLVASALLVRTLGAEQLGDPWNLTITTLPFLLLAFTTWSMIDGELWALPVSAFVTTFLVQTHIGFAVLAVPLLAAGAIALLLPFVRGRTGGPQRRLAAAVTAATVAMLAVLWLPPAVDALGSSSNAEQIWRFFRNPDEPSRTLAEGWRVVTGQFGIEPEWLTGKLPPDVSGQSPFIVDAPAPVLLLPLALAAVVIWRRQPRGRGLVAVVGLLLVVGILSVVRTTGAVNDYRLRYTWVPPTVAAVVVLWAGWSAVAQRWPRAPEVLVPGILVATVGLSGINVAGAVVAGTPHEGDSEILDELARPLIERYGDATGPVVLDEVPSLWMPNYSRGLVLQLERHGVEARVPTHRAMLFTDERVHDGGPVSARLLLATDADVPPLLRRPGLRVVARWTVAPPEEMQRAARERRAIEADVAAGRMTAAEALVRGQELNAELGMDDADPTATDVAVFLDERPGGAPPAAER